MGEWESGGVGDKSGRKLLYISILIGAFLRFYRLGYQSIWGDEAMTLQKYASGETLSQVVSAIWRNAFHPPLYFIIVHYWYMLGHSEFIMRFPSAVFGIASIPVMYLLVRRIFGPTAAGLSALVLALSPFHIWYSQEARMYTLQVLLMLCSMLFFVRAWQTRRPLDFALYVVITSLGLYTHIGTIFLVISQGVFVFCAIIKDWRRNIAWIGVQAMVLMAFMPWILQFLAVRSTHSGVTAIGFERDASPLHLGYGLYTFALGYSFGPSVSALHTLSPEDVIRQYLPAIILPMLVFGALAVLGLVHGYRMNRMGFWLVLSHLSVPMVLAGAASMMPGVPLNPRYLTAAVVPFWIALALGVEVCLRGRFLRLIPAAAFLSILLSLYNNYFEPVYAKQDVRSAAAFINERARAGDVIVISSVELGGPFIYYYKRHDVPYVGYPPGVGFVEQEKLARDMGGILKGRKRAWLVLGRTWSSDPHGIIPSEFRTRYKLVEHKTYPGIDVRCFLLNSTDRQGHN